VMLLIGLSLFALLSWIFGDEKGWLSLDRHCDNNDFSCGALVEIVPTALTLSVTFALFVYWRVRRVARTHLRDAKEEPWRLVPTATEMDVVGRDGICSIIERDLEYSAGRRPQIIVGGIGEGKTAVVVRLTQELARQGAVPVPIQLSGAKDPVNFTQLAKERFLDRVDEGLLTEDEGDKVWRRLCRDDRVVVLADGLEEALQGSDGRVTAIRRGVEEARKGKLPLVITSRPDEALRGLNAALIRLEPLSQSATVDYLSAAGDHDRDEVRRLAETAQLAESPLYLKLAHELLANDGNASTILSANGGRVAARVEVLNRWRQAMIEGTLLGGMHMDDERKAAFSGLESMACMALRGGGVDLELEAVPKWPYAKAEARDSPNLVTNVAEDMGIVERRGPTIRFRHGVLEAYLGARGLPPLIDGSAGAAADDWHGKPYLEREVLERPSRELLLALVIACCLDEGRPKARALVERLASTAGSAEGPDRFNLLACAWEIAAATGEGDPGALADATSLAWRLSRAAAGVDDLGLIEAKLHAIARMEEVAGVETYRALWTVCFLEDAYRVRLRAAQAIGAGGSMALRAIGAEIGKTVDDVSCRPASDRERAVLAEDVRRWSLVSWMLPSLLASCAEAERASVREWLDAWVGCAREGFHLGTEACLAQGFKYEANLLPHRSSPETRLFLIGHAKDLLGSTTWWYTQVSLLQALALWSLDPATAQATDLHDPVAGWKEGARHPYVKAAAKLADEAIVDSLLAGRNSGGPTPGHFIWIDEPGVAAKVGSRSAVTDMTATEGLWISPSAGWHTLKEPARQLVGEILIYLNLTEVGESRTGGTDGNSPDDVVARREKRRQDVRDEEATLPPCMVKAGHGGLLAKNDPAARAAGSKAPCTCGLGLCPYPARDEPPFRGELGETFCREQQRISSGIRGTVPEWHEQPFFRNRFHSTVAEFWVSMEKRARALNEKSLSAGS
jgi:hypothetical protein